MTPERYTVLLHQAARFPSKASAKAAMERDFDQRRKRYGNRAAAERIYHLDEVTEGWLIRVSDTRGRTAKYLGAILD